MALRNQLNWDDPWHPTFWAVCLVASFGLLRKANLLCIASSQFNPSKHLRRGDIRNLKHQDGRWLRGRHIRVKAEARPPSRFTRLSILSNIATATTRQFSEKIPLRKYLENKSSFATARDELLVTYDDETIGNEEFVLLLKKNVSRNASFPYKHHEEFDFEIMDPVQCKAEFRVEKNVLRSVAEALLISNTAY